MANIKFSQFTVETAKADVDFLVGYSGPDNVQISPTNLLADYPTGSGAAGQVTFFSAASTVTGDNNLYWDNTNKRLGIGTTTPSVPLDVFGSDGVRVTVNSGALAAGYFARMKSDFGANALRLTSRAGDVFRATDFGQAVSILTGTTATGTSERLHINSSGNVGIGTSSPSAKLHVDGTFISTGISQLGSGGSNVLLTSSSAGNVGIGTTSPNTKLQVNGTITADTHFTSSDSNATLSTSGTGGAVRLRPNGISSTTGQVIVLDTGNVGIGTSSPNTRLHVAGVIQSVESGNAAFYGGDYVRLFNNQNFRFRNSGGTVVANIGMSGDSYFNGGNVGIGTTSPGANLEIDGGSSNAFIQFTTPNTNYAGIRFGDPQSINAGRIQYYHGDASMQFDTEGKFTFEGGNVGIGTTSPLANLTVTTPMSSSATSTLYLDVEGTNTNGGGGQIVFNTSASAGDLNNYNAKITGTRVFGSGGDSELGFWTTEVSSATQPQQRMVITKQGNVGIGTNSPSVKLNIISADETVARFERNSGSGFAAIDIKDSVGTTGNSAIRFSDTTATSGEINYEHADDSLRISTSSSEKMRITSSGNVGIGITSPSAPLSFGKSTYGDVDTDAFYRIKFQDQGGVANDVGIGQTETGGLGFNITAGKKYTFSTGTSGTISELSSAGLNVKQGDVEVETSSKGLILKSPDGTRYRVTVANGGTLSVSAV